MTALATSSSLFYDRSASAMNALSKQADTLQTQISTTKRLQAPSDDVVAYQRLQGLAAATADASADSANVTIAQGLLQQGDSTLGSIGAQLSQVATLVLQARNGTLGDPGKKAIGIQLADIAQSLTGLGNAVDTRGQPLFGGSDGGPAVAANADGTHSLAGGRPATIPIGNGQSVQPGENAANVFGLPNGSNIIDLVQGLAASLSAGGTISDDQFKQVQDAGTQVSDVQASLGARGARLDLVATQIKDAGIDREAARSSLEDTDVTAAITQLQKTMTVLQATQASFTRLSSLSLFDYLK